MYQLNYTIKGNRFQRSSSQTVHINNEEDKDAWIDFLRAKAKTNEVTYKLNVKNKNTSKNK